MRGLRIIKVSFKEACKNLVRNISLTIACFLSEAITLTMIAVIMIISLNIRYAIINFEKEIDITIYLKKDTAIQEVEEQIKKIDNIDNINYISKDAWITSIKVEDDTLSLALSNLEENPLSDSFDIHLKDLTKLDKTIEALEKIDGIKRIDYGQDLTNTFINIFNALKKFIGLILILFITSSFLLISNTVKLTIFARHEEIKVMRLVGASNSYIRLPFVFEGFIIGFFSSLIPIILIMYTYILLFEKINNIKLLKTLEFINPYPFLFYLSLVIMLVGIFMGMISSFKAVRRYLNC